MAEKMTLARPKATQKEMFAHIMEAMADDVEVVEFCEHKIELLSKPRKKVVNTEAIEFAKAVATYLSECDIPKTCSEIAEEMECSTPKASAALKRLVAEDLVIDIAPAKKSGRKTYVIA